jgi:hypothetical protein
MPNRVYVVADGRKVVADRSVSRDALLFATSPKSFSQINREMRSKLREGQSLVLKRIEEATAKS